MVSEYTISLQILLSQDTVRTRHFQFCFQGTSLDSGNHGLHRCYIAGLVETPTLPTTALFGLQADETEFLTASTGHVLTSLHVLNQHAA